MDDRQDLLENPPFELSDADREVLSQQDEDFVPHTWDELQQVIGKFDSMFSCRQLLGPSMGHSPE